MSQSTDTPMSLDQIMRIVDVATTLRKEREFVEQQLNADETKSQLRRRLLEVAEVTGEQVTSEEVDAAIELYYSRLHSFQEPAGGFSITLAKLYVRRVAILLVLVGFALAAISVWGLMTFGLLPW